MPLAADPHSPDGPATPDAPLLHRVQVNGITLAYFEWRAALREAQSTLRDRQPTLLMVHATGFHGRVWDSVIHRLPGRHVIAAEQRGHGRSEVADFDTWDAFGQDLSALAVHLGLQGAVGIGHSMGAYGLLRAAALQPGRFCQLILIDPVILAPEHSQAQRPAQIELHPAAQRKNHFESAQAMFERFAGRPPYAVFDRHALRDYCEHGLKPADHGPGYQLACPPAFEAKVYPLARYNPAIHDDIRALNIPVLVLRARPQDPAIKPWDSLGTPTWPGLAAALRHGRDLQLMDKTHMLPMEDPGLVARLIGEALAAP